MRAELLFVEATVILATITHSPTHHVPVCSVPCPSPGTSPMLLVHIARVSLHPAWVPVTPHSLPMPLGLGPPLACPVGFNKPLPSTFCVPGPVLGIHRGEQDGSGTLERGPLCLDVSAHGLGDPGRQGCPEAASAPPAHKSGWSILVEGVRHKHELLQEPRGVQIQLLGRV